MKQLIIIFLTLLLSSIAFNAHSAEKGLQTGDYRVFAYTLSSNPAGSQSSFNESKSVRFHSLFISSETMNTVLNREQYSLSSPHIDINKANIYQSFALKAAYAPTSAITLHSSFGLTDTPAKQDLAYTDRVGWEVDLGVAYTFLNKFAYEVHFGYMDTGELFKESKSFTDIDDITIITNKLTMSF